MTRTIYAKCGYFRQKIGVSLCGDSLYMISQIIMDRIEEKRISRRSLQQRGDRARLVGRHTTALRSVDRPFHVSGEKGLAWLDQTRGGAHYARFRYINSVRFDVWPRHLIRLSYVSFKY